MPLGDFRPKPEFPYVKKHAFWRCPRFEPWKRHVATQPCPAWPVWPSRLLRSDREGEAFKQRIHYMAAVRQCILHQRHRDAGAEGGQRRGPRRANDALAEEEEEEEVVQEEREEIIFS